MKQTEQTQPAHQPPLSLARQLRDNGHGIVPLDAGIAELVRATMDEAAGFFDAMDALPAFVRDALTGRQPDGRARLFTGFRMPGQEYAQVYERPDMMQSFSLMTADRDRLPGKVWQFLEEHSFTSRMFAIKDAVITRTSEALGELAELLGAAPGAIDLTAHTFIQVNSYRPALFEQRYLRPGHIPVAEREYLQDPHEDGQFLTWAAANEWGLVGRALDGESHDFTIVPPSHERMLVMPSLPFTYFTGGPAHGGIPPFEHAVLREVDGREIRDRTSLICFVNPNVRLPLPVLVPSEQNAGLSMPLLVNEAQWRFGLPRYEPSENIPADAASREHTTRLLDRLYGGADA